MNTIDIQPDTQEETSAIPTLGVVGALAASAALTACGGGGESGPDSSAQGSERAQAMALVGAARPSTLEAWRFLNQATMGATEADVKFVAANGYDSWLSQQFALAPTSYVNHYLSLVGPLDGQGGPTSALWAHSAWWKQALTGKDQLRQRVSFALSEIAVVSLNNETLNFFPIHVAAWQEMIAKSCFGSYRDFIENVAKHPAMGRYLSHFANIRPDRTSGRIPDQNFARELTQLFTIGLIKLDMYGNPVVDGSGKPLAASSTASTDVRVLSHVFTGWAYGNNPDTGAGVPYGHGPGYRNDKMLTVPMKESAGLHANDADVRYSVAQQQGKTQAEEAGIVITLFEKPFSMGATPQASLTKVLDILFGPVGNPEAAHQNVAPFVARQMIQRLVTSNPSPGYVYRVATAFKASYWSIKTLVRAILLDDEARKPASYQANTYGKVREPLLRVTQLLRAFKTTTAANTTYVLGDTSNSYNAASRALALNQAPLTAPSVFNYFSPGFRLNQGDMAKLGKVAPEMQIVTETTAATYVNAIYDIINNGYFSSQVRLDLSEEVAVAATPAAVVTKINTRLFGGTMSSELATYLTNSFTAANASASALERVKTAVLLAMASPEYLVQK